jgi:alpha-glucosidase (family GH31 glycosyl hydrolase)
MYVKAVYEIAQKYRGNDFALMPRAAYTGSSRYSVFWGGDIGGTQEGLGASIIAVQRSAVMGYPNWRSDICGYNQQLLEQSVEIAEKKPDLKKLDTELRAWFNRER